MFDNRLQHVPQQRSEDSALGIALFVLGAVFKATIWFYAVCFGVVVYGMWWLVCAPFTILGQLMAPPVRRRRYYGRRRSRSRWW